MVFSQSNTQKGRYNTLNGTYLDSDRPGNSIMMSPSKDKPVFYLDSVQINRENYFINPKSIVSIEVRNDRPNKVYLTMPAETRFVNLQTFIGQLHTLPSERNRIYFVNDHLIENPKDFYVQEDQIKEIQTGLKASIEGTNIELKIIRVLTKSKESF